jgi:5,10-methylenetetrahydrofolate reductase
MKTIIEVTTPQSPDIEQFVAGLAGLNGFDAVILKEDGGIDAVVAADMLKKQSTVRIFLKIACRDRNRIALHSQLLTAASLGFRDIVLVDGSHPTRTSFPAAKPVYELDSLNLLHMLKNNTPRFSEELDSTVAAEPWTIGVQIGGSTTADMARAKRFEAAGADLYFVSSLESVPLLKEITDKPIFLCVPEEETDISEKKQEAESAGAHGLNVMIQTQDTIIDGSFAAQ